MRPRTSPMQRRAIYEDDLQARIEAAIARTQRFIKSTQPVHATDPSTRYRIHAVLCGPPPIGPHAPLAP